MYFLFVSDEVLSEAHSSPMLASRNSSKSATPSPVAPGSRNHTGSVSSQEWHNDDDIDRLVGLQGRNSLSSLGVSYLVSIPITSRNPFPIFL